MLRVGIIDSGPAADAPAEEQAAARAFLPDGTMITARSDRLGHGRAVADVVRRACPEARLLHAQVFDDRPVTSALRVAAALRWLAGLPEGQRPALICLSLGLAADRAPLRAACEAVLAQGVLLVAAHPAQGAACYPAAYPGVLAATGDARCAWDQVSRLGPLRFGAWCNAPEHGAVGMGGASIGCARLAGHLAHLMASGVVVTDADAAAAALSARLAFEGPERRLPHG